MFDRLIRQVPNMGYTEMKERVMEVVERIPDMIETYLLMQRDELIQEDEVRKYEAQVVEIKKLLG
jgi:hypothetical protein